MNILIRNVPPEVHKKLVELAKDDDRSLASYIRQLLKEFVK